MTHRLLGVGMFIGMMLGIVGGNPGILFAKETAEYSESRDIVQDSQEYLSDQQQKFTREMRKQLAAIETQIEALHAKRHELREEAARQLNEQIEKLKAQKAAILPKLEKMKIRGEAAWIEFKKEMSVALEHLRESLKDAASKLY